MSVPAQPTIVCPSCPANAAPQLLAFALEVSEVRCPTCRTRFRLVTRLVKETHSERLDAQRTRYQVTTVENGQRSRPRAFDGPPNVRLPSGAWVTLVYRGERLVGVADQSSSFWYPVPPLPPRHPQLALLLRILMITALILVALQLTRLMPALAEVASRPTGAFVLLLVLLVLVAPALLFAAQTLGFGVNKRRYLPTSTSQR